MSQKSSILKLILLIILPYTTGYINYIAIRLPLQGKRPSSASPWPMPKEWSHSPDLFTLNPDKFQFKANINCDIVVKAFDRYRAIMFDRGVGPTEGSIAIPELQAVISDKNCDGYPSISMDESYKLSVGKTITLTSKEVWGFLRGLETFSQLLYYENNQILINRTMITDSPRFKYRGMHVDTSRHYIPMSILKHNLDAMSYNKFNVFHWHIVDDQSFPFVSKTFPELSKKASYSPRHVYRPEDVADIIDYARIRGIRVIPEFDTPGHTHSWGKAFPELLTTCWANGKPGVAVYDQHAEYELFDPTKNFTYEFLTKFFSEVKDVFPDDYIHLGMDEAYYSCWESNPNITEFMKAHGMGSNYTQLELYYSERVINIVSKLNKKYVIWQDPVEHGAHVRNDTVVMVWKKPDWKGYMKDITSLGYNTVLTSCWYLNLIHYPPDWRDLYACDPHDFTGSQAEKDLVLGGETCIWNEYVDGTNMLSRLWPRASAAAERLWSPAHVNDTDTAYFRLDQHRCRMLRRGIPAEPLLGGYCGDYEWGWNEEPKSTEKTNSNSNNQCTSGVNPITSDVVVVITILILYTLI